MRLAVGLPQIGGAAVAGTVARFATEAQAAGFARLWTLDQANGGTALDGLHTLSYVAPIAREMPLGVAVLAVPHREPERLAKELATLDALCPGRLTIGVGLGPAGPDRRAGRLTEGVAAIRARLHPPVWFGGAAPVGIRRAARLGDGWIGAGSASADDFAAQVRLLRDELDRRGRDAFPIAKRVYIAVDEDRDRARAHLDRALTDFYGGEGWAERCAVYGPPHECAERLQALAAAGAQELILQPLHDHLAQLEALRELMA